MNRSFSVGVMIAGAVSGTFRSAIGGSQRALDGLGNVTRQLSERQEALTRATARYGQIGGSITNKLNSDLSRLGNTMVRLESQQKRLSSAMVTSQAARDNRMQLYGQGLEVYGAGRAAWSAVSPAVQQSATFKDNMIDMSITAGYTQEMQNKLGANIRHWSQRYNQTQEELQAATSSLISNNIDSLDDINKYMPRIALGATATRASGDLWAKFAFSTQRVFGIAAENFGASQNIITYGGNAGSFEIPDQVKWLPELASQMEGIAKGNNALAEMTASLQVGLIGAGSPDEAANNFRNFLTKIFSADTNKRFADVGIDLKSSLLLQNSEGVSPIEGILNVTKAHLEKKSPFAVSEFKKAFDIKDDKARDAALSALEKNYELGKLFPDMQVMSFVRPMLANMDRYREIREGALNAAKNDKIGTDYSARLASPIEQMKSLRIASNELALSVGESLAPSVAAFVKEANPWLYQASAWVKANPQLVSGIAKTVGALILFKGGVIAAKLAMNLALTPFTSLWKAAMTVRSKWLLLTDSMGQGGMLRRIASGAASLGKILGGGLAKGAMIAARAILFIGRALMMNPIGLLITGIATGAYLVYRYWDPISSWFKARWGDIKEAFSGGIVGVSSLILNWSPLGLFYKAFAGVLSYFNIDMPRTFTEFGGNLIDGLVNGIKNKWNDVKSSIMELGTGIKDWFTNPLSIHSPSRVFMGYGDNIVQGTVIGIDRTASLAFGATQRLANSLVPKLPELPRIPDLSFYEQRENRRRGNQNGDIGKGVMVVNNIYIDGKKQNPSPDIAAGLSASTREIEKAIEAILRRQNRAAYL